MKRTSFVILGFLADRPMTGYEIKREIASSVVHFWSESYGQLYPVLRELEAGKLATSKTLRTGERQRRVFAITMRGREELARWLAEPAEEGVVRQELMLKLFFGGSSKPAAFIPQVEAYRDRATALLVYLDRTEREWSAGRPADRQLQFRLMTVRAGQKLSRARVKWADETLAALEELKS